MTELPTVGDGIISVPLTQGQVALVDAKYADLIGRLKWCASFKPCGTCYAQHNFWDSPGGKLRTILMHRYIWEQVVGDIPGGMYIDHINGNGLDNRIENLRVVTARQNNINNYRRRNGMTSSKYPGVNWDKPNNKWMASIMVNGRSENLGRFSSEEEAAQAYQDALARID